MIIMIKNYFDVDVEPSDTIETVKEKIQNMIGVVPNKQMLSVNGEALQDNRTVSSYSSIGPRIRPEIRLMVQPSNCFRIFVNSSFLTNVKIILFCKPSDTVEDVKENIRENRGIPTDQQWLMFKGKLLEDGKTLGSYNIQNDSLLHLIMRMRGS